MQVGYEQGMGFIAWLLLLYMQMTVPFVWCCAGWVMGFVAGLLLLYMTEEASICSLIAEEHSVLP